MLFEFDVERILDQTAQRAFVISLLRNIHVNSDYYQQNIFYKKFINIKNCYENLTSEQTTSEEMLLLLQLLDSLKENSDIFIDEKNKIIKKNKLTDVIHLRMEAIKETVDKKIHFICLVKITEIQKQYIDLWIKHNPDYEINIWVDNTAALAWELALRLQNEASKAALTTLTIGTGELYSLSKENRIIKQNQAYQTIKTSMETHFFSFDQATSEFLQNENLATKDALRQIKRKNEKSIEDALSELQSRNPTAKIYRLNLRNLSQLLPDISTETVFYLVPDTDNTQTQPDKKESEWYIKELALRGNLAAASDICRLLILQEYGGICLHTDLLPAINTTLFSALIDSTAEDPEGAESQRRIVNVILEQQKQTGNMPEAQEMEGNQVVAPLFVSKIKDVLARAHEQNIPLFKSLNELKVDPYFQCQYDAGYNRAVVAKRDSLCIKKMLDNLNKGHLLIKHSLYSIDRLTLIEWNPEFAQTALKQRLVELSLRFDASVLVQYRDDNIAHKGKHARSSDELTGSRAYDYACADLYNQVEIERTKTLMASEQPFINVFFLTEETYQSHLSGPMHDNSLLINRPCYDQQYIIQLYANTAALAAANFLYQQNPLLSIWYCYDPSTQQLAKVAGTEYLGDHRKKRIILVDNRMENNSADLNIDGKIIANLLLHKPLFINQPLLRNRDIITQLSLMVTEFSIVEFTETVKFLEKDIKQPGENFQPPRFIVDFCAVLTEKEVEIKRTIIQEKLITVDTIGLKWTGTATSSGMTWNLTQPGDKKIIINNNEEDDQKTLLSHPLEKYLIDPNKIVTAFQPEPFTLGYITKTPIIHQEKLSACWIHEGTAQALLDSGQQGALLVSADSMVLLVAMGGGGGEIIIFDRQLAKIALLMEALTSSLLKKNYTAWFDSLNLSNGKLALQSLINKLFHDPQVAFERLQSRVRHNQFTFYHIDLAKNKNTRDINKILQKMYSKSDIISAIYLGNIDDIIFSDRQKVIKNSMELNITTMASTIYDINNFLKLLPKNIALYYHSFYITDYNTKTFSTKINRLQDNYSKIKYIERIKQSKADYISNNVSPYILSFAANQIKIAGRLGDEWIAMLSDIRYYPLEKKYRIPYLNIKNLVEVKTLETTNQIFTAINPLLDKSTAIIRQFCRFGNGQLPTKHLNKKSILTI
ncbi:TcdA/TcdB catalytic glycosyltransferase domain-containing protein [Candidatus Fukatsuia endosymbiont of Tuberolachnus salignus]|uniref:TcdA/TcdB catalytic glycosyltransferase domain-containing protein n=1 Tax=Candidatus Fukatsuia endosymbiont of Tuberolachnus salignus TaxID=3077957 RepID=UPI00313B8B8E